MPLKKEQRIMLRLKLIYLAIFVAALFLLSLFLLRDYSIRGLNHQLQTLHYARQDFDAGVLHVLLSDDTPSQWKKEIGQQRFEQTISSLLDIAGKHQTDSNHLQEDIAVIKQDLRYFLALDKTSSTDFSQLIIDLRLKIENLQIALNSELQQDLKYSRYWFLGLVFSAILLIGGLFVTLLRTEKKRQRMHRELYRSEHRLSLIADNIDEVIWLHDIQNDKTLYVSSAFEKLWKLPTTALYQTPDIWLSKVHPDDVASVQAILAKPLQHNTQLEYRIVLDDGEVRWISDRLFPVKSVNEDGEQKELVVAVAADITATRNLNEQLMVAQKLESLGKLTGGIAHDFNNLLTVIMGNAQLVKDLLPKDSQFSDIAALIVKAAERGASLNRQLLAFASKQQLRPEKVDVCELLSEMQNLLCRTLGDSIRIIYKPCGKNVCCFVDAGQLQNAIINLCINAKDAMPDGGCIEISLQISSENDFAVLEVNDNGEGIAETVLPYIFEPFFTTKSKHKGSGLGLSMVYGFVKQSGGHIKVISEKGQGTCFKLLLPLCADSLSVSKVDSQVNHSKKTGKKLLLVEDDEMVRDSVLQMLNNTDYIVIAAANADTGLDLLSQHTDLDIVLTDIVMPGQLNGIGLADYVRQHYPKIAVVLTSGYVGDLHQQYASFSSYEFLPKPFSKSQLMNALSLLE